jgi:hypothetical protein
MKPHLRLVTPTDHLAGYEWARPMYLSRIIDVNEASEYFRGWLLTARPHLPPDEAAFADQLIRETCRPEHVLLMVDFVASAYKRQIETSKAA